MPPPRSSDARPKAKATVGQANSDSVIVLVVEDGFCQRVSLQRHLLQEGCACSTAENGIEALEEITAMRYDLIFMDLHMPYIGEAPI